MEICAHTLVKNEERYIWYTLMSVIDHLDKIMVWDTGSTDKTMQIVEGIRKKYPGKIELEKYGDVTAEKYTVLRQKMLDRTKADWFMILDGDEVWWNDSIKKVTEFIKQKGAKYDTIVTPYYNIIGDIYHHQERSAGMYEIGGKKGHLNIRFINRKIPGLYTTRPHGQHGYFDDRDILIQDRDKKRRIYLNAPYAHFTNVIRSTNLKRDLSVIKRKGKLKYEIGEKNPLDFHYPEVFFLNRPEGVVNVWKKMNRKFLIKSMVSTIPRKLKRRIYKGKSGY